MKITITTTSPAVPSGPTIGPSQVNAEKPVTIGDETTTGRDEVPRGASAWSMPDLMSSSVSCSFSTEPPLPAPRTSAIFSRMLTRYRGRSAAREFIWRASPQPERPRMVKTRVTARSTAGTRPSQRSSHVTAGVSTKVIRMASAIGTSSACAT